MKVFKNLVFLLLFTPFAAFADDVGVGQPGSNGPNATDPDGPTSSSTETETSWMDIVLEWFSLEEESTGE